MDTVYVLLEELSGSSYIISIHLSYDKAEEHRQRILQTATSRNIIIEKWSVQP